MLHSRVDAYTKYYQSQLGGSANYPVFIGGQHGDGLGSFFRGILRFVAPIALRGLSVFAANTIQSHEQGASLKDAARGAIKPALGAMASELATRHAPQSGSGASALFRGVQGIPYTTKNAYKSIAFKDNRKRKAVRKHRKAKKSKPASLFDGSLPNF